MSIYQQHKPGGDNDLYLKLKDGDRVKMRIASEPAVSVFKEGDRPRYSWVVWNRDSEKAQVYSAGVSVYTGIADLTEEWGDPEEFDIVVKRTGSGMQDTSYSVTPVKKSDELTDEQTKEVEKVDLLQAVKGKWLSDYVDDGELPAPVMDGGQVPAKRDKVAPMSEEMPDDFLLDEAPEFDSDKE